MCEILSNNDYSTIKFSEIDKLSEQEVVHSFKPEVVSENSIINVDEKDIVIEARVEESSCDEGDT